ncbi:hypothetical protein GLOTRDRAFT_111947 [Gloeophyllum trabeum ATCC 11539]|uniref:F-box domain-containing protein n=1 Tax=Gloeophyllum trabeum (strain ATCC 11539 / FP-39264 / Madison 617) TaxID=670483 RepID=S7RL11_GLOTA|nr:uncharacterized protein GLOTRDRAFT_111947 [Gloeophyllum trabeum ATCC 11539]EPQ53359.1 hypothetical protein GLOTRDRAFT_111947 [Gloeophyllum trabeum ATCC 11539]
MSTSTTDALPPTKSPLLTLPAELIEAILIALAPSCVSPPSPLDDPALRPEHTLLLAHTLAALSVTCRQLNRVLASPPDGHLWREIYLGVWDDPRRAINAGVAPGYGHGHGSAHGEPSGSKAKDVDWEGEFKARVRAAAYFLSAPSSPSPSSSHTTREQEAAFRALLATLHTAHPIPPALAAPLASWANFPVPGQPLPAVFPRSASGSGSGGEGIRKTLPC